MCLITLNTTETTFSKPWLEDFFSYNQDGLGVMYAEGGELVIEKFVPKSAKDAVKFYQTHVAGKNAAVHWRMKTHGKIDNANAHPYEVLNKADHGIDLWMMHNGILQGVANDNPDMSDTWHFIRDTVRPMLALNPDLLQLDAFVELLEDRIGVSNKLVFMDDLGRMTVINKAAFTSFSGALLSNTYAWSSQCRSNVQTPYVEDVKALDYWGRKSTKGRTHFPKSTTTNVAAWYDEDDYSLNSTSSFDFLDEVDQLEKLVWQYPGAAAEILDAYGITARDFEDWTGLGSDVVTKAA